MTASASKFPVSTHVHVLELISSRVTSTSLFEASRMQLRSPYPSLPRYCTHVVGSNSSLANFHGPNHVCRSGNSIFRYKPVYIYTVERTVESKGRTGQLLRCVLPPFPLAFFGASDFTSDNSSSANNATSASVYFSIWAMSPTLIFM
jgi:hypothetical protein